MKENSKKWPAVILALVFILALYYFLVEPSTLNQAQQLETVKAKVTEVLDISENKEIADQTQGGITSTQVSFKAKVGKEEVLAYQQVANLIPNEKLAEKGDWVVLVNIESQGQKNWVMASYHRIGYVTIVAVALALILIILGLKKGLNSLIALVLTVAMIFFVFIPMIIQGASIYFWTLVTAFYSIFITIYLITGWSDKSLVTILGCVFGTLVAAGLSYGLGSFLHLTGGYDDATLALHRMASTMPIDLRALIFAGITIGALGAVMDVAMDISSSLYEIRLHAKVGFKELYKSGISIGRDLMGTMTNTLVLAYIGGSISSVLIRVVSSSSMIILFNTELIIVDLLQALLGSIALVLTMPLTAFFAAALYSREDL
ncbi:MAG: YibE/F family protein [Tissierellia bacterium]|nr:YibE/F family protein [Tissierellia bacterium]